MRFSCTHVRTELATVQRIHSKQAGAAGVTPARPTYPINKSEYRARFSDVISDYIMEPLFTQIQADNGIYGGRRCFWVKLWRLLCCKITQLHIWVRWKQQQGSDVTEPTIYGLASSWVGRRKDILSNILEIMSTTPLSRWWLITHVTVVVTCRNAVAMLHTLEVAVTLAVATWQHS